MVQSHFILKQISNMFIQLNLPALGEKNGVYGRNLKTYQNHPTKIITQPGIIMKVLRGKRIVLFIAYFLLLVLTLLNLANYRWTKEPQQCNLQMRSTPGKKVVGMVDDKVCKKCPPQSLRLLEEECLKYNTIVIKGVRVLDVNVLAPLMEDPSLDLKVYHLVRDPRAMANSRIKLRHRLIRENLQAVRSRDPKLENSVEH